HSPPPAPARARGGSRRVPDRSLSRPVRGIRAGDGLLRRGRALAARAADVHPLGARSERRRRAGRGGAPMKPPRGRRFPPLLIISLTAIWLLANQSLAPGQIVLGVALAVALAWISADLRPLQARIGRIWIAGRLVVLVLLDIIRSNFAVLRIVLGLVRDREVRSGFVRIP